MEWPVHYSPTPGVVGLELGAGRGQASRPAGWSLVSRDDSKRAGGAFFRKPTGGSEVSPLVCSYPDDRKHEHKDDPKYFSNVLETGICRTCGDGALRWSN